MVLMSEFLTSGRLGEVQLGLRPEQVTDVLGPADEQSTRRRPLLLLRYGAVELAFLHIPDTDDSRLVCAAIHFDQPDREVPQRLRPTDWMPTSRTTEAEFRRFLAGTGVPVHSSVRGEQEHLILASGANAVFVEGTLHSIHFKRSDKKPERKQMTVSLPEQTVEMLKRRALEKRVSVQDLLENLIKAGT